RRARLARDHPAPAGTPPRAALHRDQWPQRAAHRRGGRPRRRGHPGLSSVRVARTSFSLLPSGARGERPLQLANFKLQIGTQGLTRWPFGLQLEICNLQFAILLPPHPRPLSLEGRGGKHKQWLAITLPETGMAVTVQCPNPDCGKTIDLAHATLGRPVC